MDIYDSLKSLFFIFIGSFVLIVISGIILNYLDLKEKELVIKNSDNYTVYDNCYEIFYKYYCE